MLSFLLDSMESILIITSDPKLFGSLISTKRETSKEYNFIGQGIPPDNKWYIKLRKDMCCCFSLSEHILSLLAWFSGPPRVFSRSSVYILWLLFCVFVGFLSMTRFVSYSFGWSWKSFPPIWLSCLAYIWRPFSFVLMIYLVCCVWLLSFVGVHFPEVKWRGGGWVGRDGAVSGEKKLNLWPGLLCERIYFPLRMARKHFLVKRSDSDQTVLLYKKIWHDIEKWVVGTKWWRIRVRQCRKHCRSMLKNVVAKFLAIVRWNISPTLQRNNVPRLSSLAWPHRQELACMEYRTHHMNYYFPRQDDYTIWIGKLAFETLDGSIMITRKTVNVRLHWYRFPNQIKFLVQDI